MRAFKLFAGIAALWFLALLAPAQATNCASAAGTCFWIGGTGTLNMASDGSHWSESTGSSACSCEPSSTSVVTFDGASGGGTVTVTVAGGTLTLGSITMGAFTGTLDFATSNNNVTLSAAAGFSGSGAGTRTLNLGNGTWTLSSASAAWTMTTTTGLTFAANSSTITFTNTTAGTPAFSGGGLTYSTVNVVSVVGAISKRFTITGANTYTTLTLGAGIRLVYPNSATQTITNFTFSGTRTQPIALQSSSIGTAGTFSVASGSVNIDWATMICDFTATGGATWTATNSYNFNIVTGITVTQPSFSGGIIGG